MLAGHRLAYVKQDGVVTALLYLDFTAEIVEYAALPYVTGSTGGIYCHSSTVRSALLQLNRKVRGVVIGQSVVVPQDSVTFVGYYHGD